MRVVFLNTDIADKNGFVTCPQDNPLHPVVNFSVYIYPICVIRVLY